MSGRYRARIDGRDIEPADDWQVRILDLPHGLVSLGGDAGSILAAVEGSGEEWWVTLHGRRLRVELRTWRERVLAEADVAAQGAAGPLEVRATLPGLIVAVQAEPGSEVVEGAPLVTIEAMKMQNEVRAPRAGRILEVMVAAGATVAAGAILLRLE